MELAVEPVPEVPLLEPEEEIIGAAAHSRRRAAPAGEKGTERMAKEDPEGLARPLRASG